MNATTVYQVGGYVTMLTWLSFVLVIAIGSRTFFTSDTARGVIMAMICFYVWPVFWIGMIIMVRSELRQQKRTRTAAL